MCLSGAVTGLEGGIMTSARNQARCRTLPGLQPVRAVLFVAGAGATTPCSVGRRFAAGAPPTTGATTLASALSSSRSQLAAHSGFAFELASIRPSAYSTTGYDGQYTKILRSGRRHKGLPGRSECYQGCIEECRFSARIKVAE